jgi:hypothetical protein
MFLAVCFSHKIPTIVVTCQRRTEQQLECARVLFSLRKSLENLVAGVGEVGLRKHHPRSVTLATFGLYTVSVSWGSLRYTGTNKTLMPLMPCEFCCAEMIPRGGAYLRCRRYGWPRSGDEGPRGPGTRRAGRGHRVRGLWRHGQGVRRGATPPVQDRCFVAEGAAILDTWPPPTCKAGSGQGRDKGGRV